jgi:hypothetical protein
VSLAEASRRSGFSRNVLREAVDAGLIPAYRPTAFRLRICMADVVAWVERNQINARACALVELPPQGSA